jgi:multidrug efflux pump subunit AcrA (membrane-fusion protein)
MTRKRQVLAGVALAVVAIGAILVVRSGSGGTDEAQLIVPRPVERRTLQDVLTISGELRREEIRKINSPVDGRVSQVHVDDGDEVDVGDAIFALDGRSAVAVPGDFAFFRPLDPGSDGPDVRQLEQILADSGYRPGAVDTLFTESTRSALARWQIDHGYGGLTPEPDETVTVSLQANSAGYDIGKANTIAVTIGPSVPGSVGAASSSDVAIRPAIATKDLSHAHLASLTSRVAAGTPDKPSIEVSVSPSEIDEGDDVTFTFTADPAPAASTTIDIATAGDATGGDSAEDSDYTEIADTFVFPAGQTSFQITVDTFVDEVVEDDEEITVSLSDQFGNDPNYIVGPVNEATAVIRANGDELTPVLTLTADTDVIAEDGSATLTLESTVELNRDLDVSVSVVGSATPGRDYTELDDEVTLTAGSTETTLTLSGRSDDEVERDEFVTVSIVAGSDPYAIGSPSRVTVVIESDDVPEMNLLGGGRVSEGGSTSFTIVADEAVVEDTSVNYQVSGSADPGVDYEALPGTVVMRAGTSVVTVPIRTLDDDVVFQPSDMIVADWPARVGTVQVDEGEFVLQGEVVLTLTEPDFTVTLSVSPSDRSELAVAQAVTVELEAGGQEVPGVIIELDDNATVADDGAETYEGVVDVTEELAGVDGASVSIDVTLDERVDVLAVPVAAVLSTGGEHQVRVVDDDGKIERVNVEVGLVDDEFIEIVSGLDGDELVIVSVDSEAVADAGAS